MRFIGFLNGGSFFQEVFFMWSPFPTDDFKSISDDIEQALIHHFQESLTTLAQALGVQSASLYITDLRTGHLCCAAEYGNGINFMEVIRFGNGPGLAAWIALKRRMIYLPDIHRGSRHGYAPVRSYLATPIFLHDEVAGVLTLADIVPHAFDNKFDAIHAFIEKLLVSLKRHSKQSCDAIRPRDLTGITDTPIPTEYEPKHPVD
jgi:hypothetical protein